MSQNIHQIFIANPITSNTSTDLMYFGQSPYSATNDAAMTYANFAAQFGAPFTPAALTEVNDTNVTLTLGGTPTTALLQATSITAGWTGQLAITRGGTGVNAVTTSPTATAWAGWDANKNFTTNAIITGVDLVTLIGGTSTLTVASQQYVHIGGSGGTLVLPDATTLQVGQAYWIDNDAAGNVTVNMNGGSTLNTVVPGAFLTVYLASNTTAAGVWYNYFSLPSNVQWGTSTLGLTYGGTNAALTASNGGIVWSNATQLQILSGTSTANQVLLSGSTATPAWSTATYPATTTINQLLYSSAANTITGLATATTAVLTTSASVPTWASELSLALGGTNANLTASNGGIFYSTASAGAILAGTSTANQILLSGSSTTPAWSTATYPATTTINQLLYSSAANTIGGLSTVNSASLTTTAAGIPTWLAQTDGQIIIGSSAGAPAAATISAGTGISVTNGHNTISIAATGGGMTWSTVTTATNAAVNNGYFTNSSSSITVTLPATAAVGSIVQVAGQGTGGWTLAANTGQTIQYGNTASSSGGSFSSTNQYDTISVVCQVANTTWQVLASISAGLTKA